MTGSSRTPTQIGVDRMPLNGAGAPECYFDDDVVETARFEARQRIHLRARLDLKHTTVSRRRRRAGHGNAGLLLVCGPRRLIPASTRSEREPTRASMDYQSIARMSST